jgi:hypothetical protein
MGEEEVVLLMNEDFGLCTVLRKKNAQICRSANIRRLNLRIKRRTKCETVAKIQDKKVARLWSNEHVQHHRNLLVL